MALDITIIDNYNLPQDTLPVALEIYGVIHSFTSYDEEKFPFMMRMKNYYDDADYNAYEVPFLLEEIRNLKTHILEEKPKYYKETIEFLGAFEVLCLEAISKNFSISAIAD